MRDFGAALEARPVPQLPRDLPPPHPVWGAVSPPKSNAARQALLVMLLSAGGWMGGGMCKWSVWVLGNQGARASYRSSRGVSVSTLPNTPPCLPVRRDGAAGGMGRPA